MRKTAPASKKAIEIQASIPVAVFKEGRMYIAYTPVLDLAAQGKSLQDVQKNFADVLDIYFEETLAEGTFEKDLRAHGWSKQKQRGWLPPAIAELPKNNTEGMELKAFVLTPFPNTAKV